MNQEEINNILVDICELANIIDTNYIEYVSAILLIAYTSEKHSINKWKTYSPKRDTIQMLNYMLEEILVKYYRQYNIFTNFEFGTQNSFDDDQLSNSLLKEIIIKVKELYSRLENDEHKNEKIASGYEEIVNHYLQENRKLEYGELCTPKEIARLLSDLTIDEYTRNIYDPICGTGSFLIEASKNIKSKETKLNGIEKGNWKYNIAVVNLILHEVESFEISRENQETYDERKYDVIITNPPFAGRNLDKKILHYDNGVIYDELYFLIDMVKKLENDGKLSIILPQGAAFRQKDKGIRKKLINDNLIEAVIQLPENLFFGAKNSVILLVIRKNRKDDKVLFINASNEFEKQKKCNVLTKQNIKRIKDTYDKYENIDNFSYVARIEEIEDKEFDLSVKKYVKNISFNNEERICLKELYNNIVQEQNKILELEQKIEAKIK